MGKKSWNVYNADNIAKVKRDEAAAAAREEAEEQRMQEADAERRIQILRGLKAEPPPAPVEGQAEAERDRTGAPGRERKRRRIAGEDDTDRDIRFAQENNALVPAKAEMQLKSKKSSDAPITDINGHINLFPAEGSRRHAPKNAEVEAEKAKKQKEYEDQYTMRFSNAAGFKQAIGQKPWYQTIGVDGNEDGKPEAVSKDVWGNEDPRRKERQTMRIAADDPLAAIQRGVAGVREVEKERRKWKEEKEREMREIEAAERRRRKRKKRSSKDEDLENFSLDGPAKDDKQRRHHDRRNREDTSRHSHRHRSRSRDRGKFRSHTGRRGDTTRGKARERPGWEPGPGGRYSSQFAHA